MTSKRNFAVIKSSSFLNKEREESVKREKLAKLEQELAEENEKIEYAKKLLSKSHAVQHTMKIHQNKPFNNVGK